MKKTKIILFNGPIGCGKTEATKWLLNNKDIIFKGYETVRVSACKDKLHKLTMEFFNVEPETYWAIYNDRRAKEVPSFLFKLDKLEALKLFRYIDKEVQGYRRITDKDLQSNVSLSIREAMIYVSELVCKPAFGKEYFGAVRANNIKSNEIIIDDSAGFEEELEPLTALFDQSQILIIKVKGRGDFIGDSRSYIDTLASIRNEKVIYNDSLLTSFLAQVQNVVTNFVEGRNYDI